MLTTPARYLIRVQGQLGQEWATWFGGLIMTWEPPGETVFTGQVTDQAALHGILNIIRDLGLPLLEVRCLNRETESTVP